MWSIFILLSISGCSYYIVTSLTDYLDFQVFTNLKVNNQNDLTYPAISICSYNYSPLETVSECKFAQQNQCILKSFIIYGTNTLMYCLKINGGGNGNGNKDLYISNRAGYEGGLTLDMILPLDDTFFFYISDNNIQPMELDFNSVLSRGHVSLISINRVENIKLDQPYSDCLKDITQKSDFNMESEMFREVLMHNESYRQINCYDICLKESIYERCNCSFNGISEYNDVTIEKCDYSNLCVNGMRPNLKQKNSKNLNFWGVAREVKG